MVASGDPATTPSGVNKPCTAATKITNVEAGCS
jgi:hypothetical protein